MKHALRTLVLIFAVLLVSCGDSRDKLVKDQLAWTNEVSEVLNKVADGKLSSSEAAEKIRKLGKQGDEFMKRKEVLYKDIKPEEVRELTEKYKDELSESVKGLMNAMQNVVKSGRMTEELQEAMVNMKGN